MSLVVVGTDTEVGKTVVSGVILARYAKNHALAYWKPVASGTDEPPTDTESVREWVGDRVDVLDESYTFAAPLSPHVAARLESRRVDPDRLLEALVGHGMARDDRHLIVEGVGGLLVPMTDSGYLLTDLLRDMHLPCVLVARSGLGTINHTLLSLEALRARDLEIAGVVLSGPRNPENRRAIAEFGKVDIISEVEPLPTVGEFRVDRVGIEQAAASFDKDGILEKYFE